VGKLLPLLLGKVQPIILVVLVEAVMVVRQERMAAVAVAVEDLISWITC
jgi:hypothetical protein